MHTRIWQDAIRLQGDGWEIISVNQTDEHGYKENVYYMKREAPTESHKDDSELYMTRYTPGVIPEGFFSKSRIPPHLQSYEDCFRKVKPEYFIDTHNEIAHLAPPPNVKNFHAASNRVPSRKCAEQLQAAAKLFVITEALNGGEWVPEAGEPVYGIYYSRNKGLLCVDVAQFVISSPYNFKSKELGLQAIRIASPIWLKYFGV